MALDPLAALDELQTELDGLPDGLAKLLLLERAVELADAAQDLDLGFEMRMELTGQALTAGRGDVLSVAFAWCIARFDESPERFPDFDVMWAYRWVISELAKNPAIPRIQVLAMIDEMTTRYRSVGASMRSVEMLRLNVSTDLGDSEMGRTAFSAAHRARKDEFCDDPESEMNFSIGHYYSERLYKIQLQKSERFWIDPGKTDEFHVGKILCNALLPLLLAGRWAEAERCHELGLRANRKNSRFVDRIADHIRYLTHSGQTAKSLALFRKWLPTCLASVNASDQLEYTTQGWLLMKALEGGPAIRLKLPGVDAEKHDALALSRRFHDSARGIAGQFDQRNGNDFFSKQLKQESRDAAVILKLRKA